MARSVHFLYNNNIYNAHQISTKTDNKTRHGLHDTL